MIWKGLDIRLIRLIVFLASAVAILISGASCTSGKNGQPITPRQRVEMARELVDIAKQSGARAFFALQVPLRASVWQKIELGVGNDGNLIGILFYEPDGRLPQGDDK